MPLPRLDLVMAVAGHADFLICPDNTFHQALSRVEPRSPVPWLHIAEAVADHAAVRGFRRLGLTGTRWLVDSDVYPDKLTARGLVPACWRVLAWSKFAARLLLDLFL